MLKRLPTIADDRAVLEDAKPDDLARMFEFALSTGLRAMPADRLADAWGILFSRYYLSPEDLVEDLSAPVPSALPRERILMLREFIRTDCSNGGAFTLAVVRQGGNIDRAALIMIADPEGLAGVTFMGSTLLHMLADACDKHIRPVLIRKAGKKALAETCDGRGIPVLIAILSLADLGKEDLIAIQDIFSDAELMDVKTRGGTGNSASQIFAAASGRLLRNAPQERNRFALAPAIRDTKMEGGLKRQARKTGAFSEGTADSAADSPEITMAQKYDEMLQNPAHDIDLWRRQVRRKL